MFLLYFQQIFERQTESLENRILKFAVPLSRVSDPGGFYPDPTFEKKLDSDQTSEKRSVTALDKKKPGFGSYLIFT